MAVNKVVYNTKNGEQVLIDLTADTVTKATLGEGVKAHDASGNVIVGTAKIGTAETWTITLKDGSIVTKAVFVE